jgi:hypothetical protein
MADPISSGFKRVFDSFLNGGESESDEDQLLDPFKVLLRQTEEASAKEGHVLLNKDGSVRQRKQLLKSRKI